VFSAKVVLPPTPEPGVRPSTKRDTHRFGAACTASSMRIAHMRSSMVFLIRLHQPSRIAMCLLCLLHAAVGTLRRDRCFVRSHTPSLKFHPQAKPDATHFARPVLPLPTVAKQIAQPGKKLFANAPSLFSSVSSFFFHHARHLPPAHGLFIQRFHPALVMVVVLRLAIVFRLLQLPRVQPCCSSRTSAG